MVRYGLDEAAKRLHVRKLNLARRHLTEAQKRKVIADALKEAPQKSNRQHARELGVDKNTVKAVREKAESTGEIHQLDRTIGKDGKTYPATKPRSVVVESEKALEKATKPEVAAKLASGEVKTLAQATGAVLRDERREQLQQKAAAVAATARRLGWMKKRLDSP